MLREQRIIKTNLVNHYSHFKLNYCVSCDQIFHLTLQAKAALDGHQHTLKLVFATLE